MDYIFLFAQILAFIACGLNVISMQCKKRKEILCFLILGNIIGAIGLVLSKGLEFDAVIILNKDDYNKDSILDMKLLYVSMTRALHKLYIK